MTGQEHLIGPQGVLFQVLKSGNLPSKEPYAGHPEREKQLLQDYWQCIRDRPFNQISAINSGVKEVRDLLQKAENSSGVIFRKKSNFIRRRDSPIQ